MSIMLGDLSVEQMELRAGVEFPAALKDFMADRHQPSANNIQHGKWHCFDLPFMLVCGDMATAEEIYKHLLPITSEFKEVMQIGVQ